MSLYTRIHTHTHTLVSTPPHANYLHGPKFIAIQPSINNFMTTQVKESSGPHSDACRHVTVVPVRTGVAVSTSNSLCVLHAPSAYVCIHVCACCPAVCVHVCVRRGSRIFYLFIFFCSWITRLPWWLGRATFTGKEESEGEPDCNIKKPWITVTVLHCWRLEAAVCLWMKSQTTWCDVQAATKVTE